MELRRGRSKASRSPPYCEKPETDYRDYRRDRPVSTSASMSEGERASSISADYLLPFALARARFFPDVRRVLENVREPALFSESPRPSSSTGGSDRGLPLIGFSCAKQPPSTRRPYSNTGTVPHQTAQTQPGMPSTVDEVLARFQDRCRR